jgi:hypothetical protein
MQKETKLTKLFIGMAITALTVLFMMFFVIIVANATATKSEMQTWLMGTIPTIGIFLLIALVATLVTGIIYLIQNISKFKIKLSWKRLN